ncbi:MAG: mannose-6-phosphate isomerase, class I [Leucobacter sp.]
MLVFIENTPRAYAWGSRDALPELLGTAPTGEPQAELWLGAHPGGPATVAKGAPTPSTLIDLIERDPEAYGVDGGQLPFLLKVLAIGAPLSLQVHPDSEQAAAGFDAEEAAGVPRDAKDRNYGDRNHKPELLVALSEVTALCGFRSLEAAGKDLEALAAAVAPGPEAEALAAAAGRCAAEAGGAAADDVRRAFVCWALSGEDADGVRATVQAVGRAVQPPSEVLEQRIGADRLAALRQLVAAYPEDPGVLVSLLLHLVRLLPGEAVYLKARQLHAYLSGIAVEVMAASDNVLRAGLTEKHIDVAELLSVLDPCELADPRFPARTLAPGLVAYEPGVPDFRLLRARLCEPEGDDGSGSAAFAVAADDRAETVAVDAHYPLVLIVTSGRVRVERPGAEFGEVASVGRGQSLYVSAGEPVELSGLGEAFVATVGAGWGEPSAHRRVAC